MLITIVETGGNEPFLVREGEDINQYLGIVVRRTTIHLYITVDLVTGGLLEYFRHPVEFRHNLIAVLILLGIILQSYPEVHGFLERWHDSETGTDLHHIAGRHGQFSADTCRTCRNSYIKMIEIVPVFRSRTCGIDI